MDLDRLQQVLSRLRGYLRYEWPEVIIELVIIWVVVFVIFRFLRGTRGARVIKGMALVLVMATLVIQVLGREESFDRLNFLYTNFLAFASLALVIVFQPELRRALVRLGETRIFSRGQLRKARVVEELVAAVGYLSKNKVGALIAIERDIQLGSIVEAGTALDARVSRQLLNTIFWPGSALHDMGVVIRGDRINAAGCQFPLAEGADFPQELGSRHRAAVGMSQESDALIIVVSEETGVISTAERGTLTRNLTTEKLRDRLTEGLPLVPVDPDRIPPVRTENEAA